MQPEDLAELRRPAPLEVGRTGGSLPGRFFYLGVGQQEIPAGHHGEIGISARNAARWQRVYRLRSK